VVRHVSFVSLPFADDVADGQARVLGLLDINELNTRAGYRPGFGYVNPAEATSGRTRRRRRWPTARRLS
jgi:hypothetical protein